MVQPAENWAAKNLPGPFDGTRERRILLQGEMCAGAAHRTVLREVLYRHHPWFGRRVCIHGTVDKDGYVVCLSEIKLSHTDDAVRRGLGDKKHALPS